MEQRFDPSLDPLGVVRAFSIALPGLAIRVAGFAVIGVHKSPRLITTDIRLVMFVYFENNKLLEHD